MSPTQPHRRTVALHLACNDHRNGLFTGSFDAVEVQGIHLDCPPTRLSHDERSGTLRVGKLRRMATRGHATWVGNWCWDAWFLAPEDARDVLEYLRRKGASLTEAPTEFFDAWEAGGPLPPLPPEP